MRHRWFYYAPQTEKNVPNKIRQTEHRSNGSERTPFEV